MVELVSFKRAGGVPVKFEGFFYILFCVVDISVHREVIKLAIHI